MQIDKRDDVMYLGEDIRGYKLHYDMYFTGNPDGPSIEKHIAHYKLVYPQWWRLKVNDYLLEDAKTWWWNLVNHDKVYRIQDEEF